MLTSLKTFLGTSTPTSGPGSFYAVYRFYLPVTITFIVIALFLLALAVLFIWSHRRTAGLTWGLLGALLLITTLWINFHPYSRPIIFSERAMLTQLWYAYKGEYLEPGTGRTLDKQRDNITTSEGQAYTMLRAVWMDDRPTFDTSFQWAKYNIQRPDHLFSWLFGKQPNGKFGILSNEGGNNTASDADVDTALALIFAYSRWQDPSYLREAALILPAIWDKEVVMINGQPYLAANNVEKNSTAPTIVINPSYFAPYAYRIFAKFDPIHNWLGLVDTSYAVLNSSLASSLDRTQSIGLPPDWITLNRQTGALAPSSDPALTTNYGYDAMRIGWRLGLDYQWFNEPRATTTAAKMNFLNQIWQKKSFLTSTYTHDGKEVVNYESPAMYGGSLGIFLLAYPNTAKEIYQAKLLTLFNPDTTRWKSVLGYYDDNLAWFGIALYRQELKNLSEDLFSKNSFPKDNISPTTNKVNSQIR